jgi:hypothetical protein
VKIGNLLSINAIIFIGLGIAFALYGPLTINLFDIMAYEGNAVLFWYVQSFARIYGAALFGFGFLTWAVRSIIGDESTAPRRRRSILQALLLGNIIGLFAAITQQASVWGTFIGWGLVILYAILTLGYTYFLLTGRR